jgi:hypothetical protein
MQECLETVCAKWPRVTHDQQAVENIRWAVYMHPASAQFAHHQVMHLLGVTPKAAAGAAAESK